MKSPWTKTVWLVTCMWLCAMTDTRAQNLLPPIDETGSWKPVTWSGEGDFDVVKQGPDDGNCFLIASEVGGDLSWSCTVDVEPNATYRLSARIKTEGLQPNTGRGALLNVHQLQQNGKTEAMTGDNDWTAVEAIINTRNNQRVQINCLLGGWGKSTGRAWYAQPVLEKLDIGKLTLQATFQTDLTGEPISPFIYSQFIEHLGRCIYGGIWAEMLEDRKFYYPITERYDPYQGDLGGRFPVVGASPWEILGGADGVTMMTEDSFVGDHTPLLDAGTGIRQNDLGVVAGKSYVGYVWLKSPGNTARVDITLHWGDGDDDSQTVRVTTNGSQYARYPFEFQAKASTDTAKLEFGVKDSACRIGAVSLMPGDNVRGMRADTLALLKHLDAPMYRWPGGNFVSGYNWRDGIGDRDRRPPRVNPAWTGVEHNDYGIDEFIDFCREVSAEPMIAANTGYGDAYSAAQEVEYCNGKVDTVGGSWRAENGSPRPYAVKYWCVGNEMFGPWQLGFMQLKHYTIKHNRVARAMWDADPTIELVGVGAFDTINTKHDPNENRPWSTGMLEQCADHMTYLSEHFYVWEKNDVIADHVAQLANRIRRIAQHHRQMQTSLANLDGRIVPIAMDEWNYWHRPYEYGELGCVYELRDALGVAAGLHEYFRNSDIIKMAHYAQTVNVIGCVKTTKTDAFLSTTALPLILYRKHYGSVPVKVSGNFSLIGLDVAAAWTEDRNTLTIGVINPHAEEKVVRVRLPNAELSGNAMVWRIAGDDPTAHNSADRRVVHIAGPHKAAVDGKVEVPPHSVSLYRLPDATGKD